MNKVAIILLVIYALIALGLLCLAIWVYHLTYYDLIPKPILYIPITTLTTIQ